MGVHPWCGTKITNMSLKISNIQKSFGKTEAVSNISFEAANGKITGLIGPNGSGKTTTLNIIASIITPDSGEVSLFEIKQSNNPEPLKAQIGYVPDETTIAYKLTGREFLKLNLRLFGAFDEAHRKLAYELCDLFQLADRLDDFTDEYSHGMLKKLLLISVISHAPKLLILDEPTNGLDPEMVMLFEALIKEYASRGNIALLSTHHLEFAAKFCDKVVLVQKGQIIAQGSPQELKIKTGQPSFEKAAFNIFNFNDKLEQLKKIFSRLPISNSVAQK